MKVGFCQQHATSACRKYKKTGGMRTYRRFMIKNLLCEVLLELCKLGPKLLRNFTLGELAVKLLNAVKVGNPGILINRKDGFEVINRKLMPLLDFIIKTGEINVLSFGT